MLATAARKRRDGIRRIINRIAMSGRPETGRSAAQIGPVASIFASFRQRIGPKDGDKGLRRMIGSQVFAIPVFRYSSYWSHLMSAPAAEQSAVSTYPFILTEDQEQLRKEIRDFASREIAPNVSRWDEASEFPADVVKQLGQMGLLGVIFPMEYGGSGLGYVDYVLAIEELSAVDGSVGIIVAAHNSLCTNHIFLAGNEEQRRKYIPKLASGEWLGAWGLTEPGSGSDAGAARTTAVRKGDRWVLNGNKTFITNGHYADVAVVIAVTDREQGTRGLSAFVVEKGTPGFRPGKKENKLGLRASDTSELIFEDCEIPAENLLGDLGAGFVDSMRVLDGGRISIAALSLGIARGALDASVKYVKERRQFGKAIAEFQGIQWKLADMATELDAARLLTQRAAVLKDAGHRVTRESSMAKLYASEVAVRICDEAVQLHGGYGFIKDYPAEKFYRDVKLCTIGEGTSEIQRMVIGREILKVHPSRG
jgi:alkylation response protein AidB-like acyl-CoA dehydrogenase